MRLNTAFRETAQVFDQTLNHVGVCSLRSIEIYHHRGYNKSTLANTEESRVIQRGNPQMCKVV